METQATAPKPEATLEVSTLVRKAASVEIGIANPLMEPLEFEVQYSHYIIVYLHWKGSANIVLALW